MKLSVIVPTRGRNHLIGPCLSALTRMIAGRDGFEVLVVDNNDDPQVQQGLKTLCTTAGRVRYLRQDSPGLTAARHLGAREASADVLAFIDDDSLVSESWGDALLGAFADARTGIAGGPSIPAFRASIPAWLWGFIRPAPMGGWHCGWLSLLDLGRDVPDVSPDWIWGLNYSIRKELLFDLGGFHPDLVPAPLQRWQGDGETGLAHKAANAGVRAGYVHAALVRHVIGADRMTRQYFEQRAFYQGVCDSFTRIRSGEAPETTAAEPRTVPDSPTGKGLEAQTIAVRSQTARAYNNGWTFHQGEAARDPNLLAWIRRPDYLDADIRNEIGRASGNS